MEKERNPYQFFEDIEAGAERERQKQNQEFSNFLRGIREKAETKQRGNQKNLNKALQRMHDENEERKENEIALAKAKAAREAEEEAERKFGVKTEKTKQFEEGLREMLKKLSK